MLFLMDSSGSITAPNWRIMQDFIITVVGQFPIGPTAYKFAVDVFNDNAESLISFNAYQNISTLQRLIDVLPYVQGDTRTDLALINAVNHSFTPQSGVRDPSLGFPRVAILITGLSPISIMSLFHLFIQMVSQHTPTAPRLPRTWRSKRVSY